MITGKRTKVWDPLNKDKSPRAGLRGSFGRNGFDNTYSYTRYIKYRSNPKQTYRSWAYSVWEFKSKNPKNRSVFTRVLQLLRGGR